MRIGVPIQVRHPHPPLKVFGTEVGVSCKIVTHKPEYHCLHLQLRWSVVIDWEGGNVYFQWVAWGGRRLLMV